MLPYILTAVGLGAAFLYFYDFSGKKVKLDALYQFSQVAVEEKFDEKSETKVFDVDVAQKSSKRSWTCDEP
jgi:hypothetical protein